MKKIFLSFWPLFFLFVIWGIFASPYFFRGKVPYASTYQVNFFAPWSHYERFWGPVKNNAMPDVNGQIYPWKKFTIETFKNSQIPFWNPYSFSGTPHLANFQSGVLSPFNILFFILPFIDAWSILILLQPLLAGLFMYLLMRSFKASKIGSALSSITFMFCGFIVVWMAYGTLPYAILYLPLAFFTIEKFYQAKQRRFLVLLTLTIALSFFSGHFQISFYFFLTVLAYIVFKAILKKNHDVLFVLLALVIGLVLALPQLLPSYQLYQQAPRSELFLLTETIPFQYLITIFSPDFFGNPVTRNDWFGHYAEWAGFVGIIPFVLAFFGIKKDSKTIFFAILAVLAIILSLASPLSFAIVSLKLPVISTSALSRIIVLYSFAFSALAGFGLDNLPIDKKRKRGNVLLLSIGAIFAVAWFTVLFTKAYPQEWIIVAKRNIVLPTVFFVLTAALILLIRFRPKLSILVLYLLLLIASFDSLRFAQKWMPFDPRNLVFPDVPVISAMRQHIGYGRVFGNLGGEVTVYYDLPSIEGYDPLYIGRYGEFIRAASAGEFFKGERSLVKIDRNGKYTDRVLDLLGVSLIFHPKPDTDQGWAYPVWKDKKKYQIVYSDDKFELYANQTVLPRAVLFYNFEVIKDDKALLKRFYEDTFDFRKTLLIEEDSGILPIKEASGSARIVSYRPNIVTMKAYTDKPALLFLADNFYPGWKATVNGKEEHIYRADYTFRAVRIPQGESTVAFTYNFTL